MKMITDTVLSDRLISKLGYTEEESIEAIKKIKDFTSEVYSHFEKWFITGEMPKEKFFGIEFKDILSIKEDNPIKAFDFLNWICSDPYKIANVKRLIELEYPPHMWESSIIKIQKLQPELKPLYNKWLEDNKEPEISIENYSYHFLVYEFGMAPVGAFFLLDYLITDPEKAKAALKRGIR